MSTEIHDMTPQQRLRAAAVIMRDAVEKLDAEATRREATRPQLAVAS